MKVVVIYVKLKLFHDGSPYHIETSPLIWSIDLLSKSIDWFLYDRDLRHERVSYFHQVSPYWKTLFFWSNAFAISTRSSHRQCYD